MFFKKLKAIAVSFVAEAEARHELEQSKIRDRLNAPKVSIAEMKSQMSGFPDRINLLDKTEPTVNLASELAEQKRKDEEYVLFRKAQLANDFNRDLKQVGLLTQVATVGGILNEIRKQAFPSTSPSNSPTPNKP
jgi:hypothetical protein